MELYGVVSLTLCKLGGHLLGLLTATHRVDIVVGSQCERTPQWLLGHQLAHAQTTNVDRSRFRFKSDQQLIGVRRRRYSRLYIRQTDRKTD